MTSRRNTREQPSNGAMIMGSAFSFSQGPCPFSQELKKAPVTSSEALHFHYNSKSNSYIDSLLVEKKALTKPKLGLSGGTLSIRQTTETGPERAFKKSLDETNLLSRLNAMSSIKPTHPLNRCWPKTGLFLGIFLMAFLLVFFSTSLAKNDFSEGKIKNSGRNVLIGLAVGGLIALLINSGLYCYICVLQEKYEEKRKDNIVRILKDIQATFNSKVLLAEQNDKETPSSNSQSSSLAYFSLSFHQAYISVLILENTKNTLEKEILRTIIQQELKENPDCGFNDEESPVGRVFPRLPTSAHTLKIETVLKTDSEREKTSNYDIMTRISGIQKKLEEEASEAPTKKPDMNPPPMTSIELLSVLDPPARPRG